MSGAEAGAMSPSPKVIDGLLPFSGSQWSALFSNGACGWYSKAPLANPREEVKCNAPGGIPIYCDLFALRDTAGALHRMQQTSVFLVPDSCDLSSMNNQSAGTMECKFIGGQVRMSATVEHLVRRDCLTHFKLLPPPRPCAAASRRSSRSRLPLVAGECIEPTSSGRFLGEEMTAAMHWEGPMRMRTHRGDVGTWRLRAPVSMCH